MFRLVLASVVFAVLCSHPSWLLANDAAPSGDHAQLFQQLDADQDGLLSLDELPEAQRRLFERLVRIGDANQDDQLDAKEFATALQNRRPERPLERIPAEQDEQMLQRLDPAMLFRRTDANRDGKIALGEVPAVRQRQYRQLINFGDENSDGALNLQEFTKAWNYSVGKPATPAEMKQRQQEAIDRRFQQLDSNRDGFIVMDEVSDDDRARLERLARFADRNRDRKLSREEFSTALARVMADQATGQRPETNRPEAETPEKKRPDRPAAQRPTQRSVEFMMRRAQRLDINGDKQIDRDEAQGALADRFDAIDQSGDDKIDADELRAALERYLARERPSTK